MNEHSRRDFLKMAGVGSFGAALAWPQASTFAASPTAKTNRPIRLAIKGVTYTGVWYNGAALSSPAIIDRAKKFGYDGIEIDAKRPQAFPLDVSRKDREAIRRKLAETGVQLAAVSAYNNFIGQLRMKGASVHAVVLQQNNMGSIVEFALNLTKNTGGMYEVISTATGLEDRLKKIAARIVEDHQKMVNAYQVEFLSDPQPKGELDVTMLRPGVKIARVSVVRPF